MASNVFGKPITEGTRLERAATALQDPNADNKRDEAIAYVRKQKESFGNGISTLCFFYNASGETLTFDREHSWYGKIFDLYPLDVQNGQWGAFLHVKTAVVASGSMAYVTYRVKANDSSGICTSLIGWETPWDQVTRNNHAFCDIYDDGKPDDDATINRNIDNSNREVAVRKKGIRITATIETGTSPLFEAHFNLDGA